MDNHKYTTVTWVGHVTYEPAIRYCLVHVAYVIDLQLLSIYQQEVGKCDPYYILYINTSIEIQVVSYAANG